MQMTFRVSAYPTKRQHALFTSYLTRTRHLYNAALEEREGCYPRTKCTIGIAEQSRSLTELRANPEYAAFPRRMQRWVLDRLEAAYKGM